MYTVIVSSVASTPEAEQPAAVAAEAVIRTLRFRLKDKHPRQFRLMARALNLVWNFCDDLSMKVLQRENRFISAFELQKYLNGASAAGLEVGSAVFQQVADEFATRRRQFKKRKLRWRCSGGSRRSLGGSPSRPAR